MSVPRKADVDHGVVFAPDTRPDRIYEVRVAGPVPAPDLLREIGDAELVEQEVRTVVTGRFPDQAALHGFLNRLRALGLDVVEVRRLPADPPHDESSPGGNDRNDPSGQHNPHGHHNPGSSGTHRRPDPEPDAGGAQAGGSGNRGSARQNGPVSYEVTVVGPVGPVTRTAMEPHAVAPSRTYSVVRTGVISGEVILELVLRLDRYGCDLDSLFGG